MSWHLVETLSWREPLELARAHADADMALLYSSLREAASGANSYLLLNPLEEISGDDWAQLPPLPSQGEALPLWVGYLGYGMRDVPERGGESPISLPDFRLVRYGSLYHFDHDAQVVRRYQTSHLAATREASSIAPPLRGSQIALDNSTQNKTCERDLVGGQSSQLSSNLTRTEYENIITHTIEQIRDGEFYQANITRKFFGELSSRARPGISRNTLHSKPEGIPAQGRDDVSFSLFEHLTAASPAPYSAYVKHEDTAILSSSPECFLSIDATGRMITRPIKGSARRSADATEDKKIREALITSTKNHAENLMIVDLMRNDLARVAEPQSVKVTEQSALYSYETIHHLISTIEAQKRAGVSAYDAVRACFPAGSMTGAPKIAAMKWCTEQEMLERGVYSGAIGWFGAGETCDLSVVIRTLIIQGTHFEFQVGGGIVADSTPEDEWRETITKARGILMALGIEEEAITKL